MRKAIAIVVVILTIATLLAGCGGNVPKAHFYSWMYSVNKPISKINSFVPGLTGSDGFYSTSEYELFDGIKGTLGLRVDDVGLEGWTWKKYVDESTYKTIKRAMAQEFGTYSKLSDFSDMDEAIVYRAVNYTSDTYRDSWTLDDKKILEVFTQDQLENSRYHEILLLKKDDLISIQYIPTNVYGATTSKWYPNVFK